MPGPVSPLDLHRDRQSAAGLRCRAGRRPGDPSKFLTVGGVPVVLTRLNFVWVAMAGPEPMFLTSGGDGEALPGHLLGRRVGDAGDDPDPPKTGRRRSCRHDAGYREAVVAVELSGTTLRESTLRPGRCACPRPCHRPPSRWWRSTFWVARLFTARHGAVPLRFLLPRAAGVFTARTSWVEAPALAAPWFFHDGGDRQRAGARVERHGWIRHHRHRRHDQVRDRRHLDVAVRGQAVVALAVLDHDLAAVGARLDTVRSQWRRLVNRQGCLLGETCRRRVPPAASTGTAWCPSASDAPGTPGRQAIGCRGHSPVSA